MDIILAVVEKDIVDSKVQKVTVLCGSISVYDSARIQMVG